MSPQGAGGIGSINMNAKILAIALTFASLTPNPSANGQAPKSIDISMDDVIAHRVIVRNIDLSVGDSLLVSLGANHTTPYRWTTAAQIADRSVIQQSHHDFLAPVAPPGVLGSAGTDVWTFTALKAGVTSLTTEYRMSRNPAPRCVFTLTVFVRELAS